jgi:phosphatidylserine decarboxylase
MMKSILAPIHPAGWPFILLFALITLILMLFSRTLGFIFILLTGWCVYFFRNPRRVTPQGEGLIISPGDGIITQIKKATPPKELNWKKKSLSRISIFLNVFDVHVNRIPIDGIITKILYHPGKFFNASLDKASDHNERNSIILKTPSGHEILIVQIAGLVARRILCDVEEGQDVKAGELYGIIRFGSRVDIYLPEGVNPQVIEGQRMLGGETIMADLFSDAPPRLGVCRA